MRPFPGRSQCNKCFMVGYTMNDRGVKFFFQHDKDRKSKEHPADKRHHKLPIG